MTDLREQLQTIYQQHGRLTPKLVLEEARDPEHPLHSRFTWDDAEAAEKYRLNQAHELIQSVKVSYRDDQGRPKDVRQFHAVRREQEFVYEPLTEIANDDVTRQILLRDMERDWKTLKKRYDGVREFLDLVRRDLDAA
jgi:hypothetical protein